MREIIEGYRDLIENQIEEDKENDGVLKKIKKVFVGDPYWLPASAMPCIIVGISNGTAPFRGTKFEINGTIQTSIVINIRDYYKNKFNTSIGYYEEALDMIGDFNSGKIGKGLLGIAARNPNIQNKVEMIEQMQFTTPIRRRDDGEKNQTFTFEPTVQFSFKSIKRR